MAETLGFVLVAVAVIVVLEVVADRTGLPVAALLTIAGVAYAWMPGPNVVLNPHLVLTFVIPPLLYSAALNSSLLAIRRNLRIVVSLSVALVVATAVFVGVGVSLLVPGIGLAGGVALGAAISPPDPVAALAIGRRAGLPQRIMTIIEGEGLLNDATALTTLSVAVAAVTSGEFSMWSGLWRFVVAAAGGLLAGYVVAVVVRWLRSLLSDPLMVNAVSLATPFAAYLLGEEARVSGVLAVVIAGLVLGHDAPRAISGASRLQTNAVWRLVDFLLEGFVFLLIGQQIAPVARGLRPYSIGTITVAVSVTVGVVLCLRPVWLALTQTLPAALHTRLGGDDARREKRLGRKEVLVLSWSGTRGVITLAAISTLPLTTDVGRPFPGRDLLLFCAYVVVLVTLVGQGMTFEPIVRLARLRANRADAARTRNEARIAATDSGLARLEKIASDGQVADDTVNALRVALEERRARYRRRIDLLENAEGGAIPVSPRYEAAARARRSVIEAQREELVRWRDAGRLPDASLRILERELDHEERVLPTRARR